MSNKREGNHVFDAQRAQASGMQTRNVMREDFGMEIPVDAAPLPSQGKIYPEGSAAHNCETLEIRAMTAKDEDILTSRALLKKGTVITALLRSCLVNKAVRVDQLISGDRNALMVAVRITGYGSDYEVEIPCPECDVSQKQSFSLAELPIKRLEIEPSEPGENKFTFTLPVSKKVVTFRFLTGADEQNIALTAERKRKKKLSGDIDSMVTSRLQAAVVAVDNIEDRSKLAMFVHNMPARDSRALRKFMNDNEPGIEMKCVMTCESCYESSEVDLPIGTSFFWPDA